MQKPTIVVTTLIVMLLFLAGCAQLGIGGGGGDSPDVVEGSENPTATPTNTTTPTPTLPPTFTPNAITHGGHVYDVSGASGLGGTRTVYIVQRGDTLGEIAKQYGVTVEAIGRMNRITNYDLIEVGDVLYIPSSGN